MKNLNEQYFVIFPDYDQDSSFFEFNKSTGLRSPHYRELVIGQKPVVFMSEDQTKPINKIIFSPPSIILHESIIGDLASENIFGGQLYPAIHIDADGNYNEDFFLINMFDELDCWSRTDSVYELEEGDDDDDDAYMIKYKLDHTILEGIDEDKRLMFKMGGVDRPLIFLHERVVKAFQSQNIQGYKTFKVTDYEFGVEFD